MILPNRRPDAGRNVDTSPKKIPRRGTIDAEVMIANGINVPIIRIPGVARAVITREEARGLVEDLTHMLEDPEIVWPDFEVGGDAL